MSKKYRDEHNLKNLKITFNTDMQIETMKKLDILKDYYKSSRTRIICFAIDQLYFKEKNTNTVFKKFLNEKKESK